MTVYLLDANVLIALIDMRHDAHERSADWFASSTSDGWATCPLTQNAVLRVVGRASYANSPGSPMAVMPTLAALLKRPGHRFWPDDISLLDAAHFDASRMIAPGRLTDTYLLGLAKAHGAVFATLDRRLIADAVPGGREHLHVID